MEIYLWSLLAIIAMIGSSICIKKYILNNNIYWFYFSILLYVILSFCYLNLYTNNNNIALTYTITNILAIVLFNIIGIVYLNGTCNISIIVGLILGIISIFLLTNK
jgi:multidrug transporter EmrE-like cation transporter